MIRRLFAAAAILGALTAPAAAEPAGHVLSIDGDDIYIDLGLTDGVDRGSELALHHVVIATHPRTGKKLRDSFELGRLQVVRAGESICVARAPEELKPRVAVGDEIATVGNPAPVVDPWKRAVAGKPPLDPDATEQPPEGDDEATRAAAARRVKALEAGETAWKETLGKPPAERIAIWRAYLDAHRGSPLAGAVRTEIANLAAQAHAEELRASPEGKRAARARERQRRRARIAALSREIELSGPFAIVPPTRAYQGAPVELALHVTEPERVAGAWVHYRTAGQETYRRAELRSEQSGAYLRVALPGDAVMPPRLEYFIEALPAGGTEPEAIAGSAGMPLSVAVDASAEEPPPDRVGRSRVTTTFDYVDFDGGFEDGFDQYVQAEVDFMYRFREPIHAVRVGFGTLGGDGGPKSVIDDDPTDQCMDARGNVPCRHVNFTYGYVELEHRVSRLVSLMARPMVGSAFRDRQADERDYFNSIGIRGRVRVGEEEATNLLVGVGFTQHFGTLIEAAFNFDTVPKLPIVLGAQVTDQPVLEDFGVRLLVDVGYRNWGWVYPSIRLSYQARDIDHSGVSGGAGLTFDW